MDGQGESKCENAKQQMRENEWKTIEKKENEKHNFHKQNRCMWYVHEYVYAALLYCYCLIAVYWKYTMATKSIEMRLDGRRGSPSKNVCIKNANQVYRIIIGKLNIYCLMYIA